MSEKPLESGGGTTAGMKAGTTRSHILMLFMPGENLHHQEKSNGNVQSRYSGVTYDWENFSSKTISNRNHLLRDMDE